MHFVSQTEQAGGYWLITVTLDNEETLPIGYQLSFKDQTLALFQQQGKTALFLSQTSLNLANNTALSEEFKHNLLTPAWRIFTKNLAQSLSAKSPLLLLAKDDSIANLFHFARQKAPEQTIVTLLEASNAFPFAVKPAKFLFENVPAEAIGACTLLEDWKIPNRLCSSNGLMGCYEGTINEILPDWKPKEGWAIIDFRSLNEKLTNV